MATVIDPEVRSLRSPAAATVRVLHLINGEHYSGAERVQDLLALRLPDEGFDVTFACVKPGRFAEARRSQQSPLLDVPMRSRIDLSCVSRLARLLRADGFQLLHTHTPRTALVGGLAAARAGVPMIYHLHSPTARDTTHRLRNWLNAASERLSWRRACRIIAVSHSLGQYAIQRGFPRERIAVVPNGVPTTELPRRFDPQGTWTLGTVALFRPRKGIEVLIDALALLRIQQRPARLLAVGGFETPEYEAEIRDRIRCHQVDDLIEWTGFTRNVAAELARMDLFILPSLFGEGLPMVVLEAMASGVPVIASRVEGVPEAVRDGLDGLLAEPGNATDLAKQISRVMDGQDEWNHLRQSAFERQRTTFSDESMAAGVAAVYREVLDQ